MAKNKSSQQPSEKERKDARRALIIFIVATAFFIYAVVNYLMVEG